MAALKAIKKEEKYSYSDYKEWNDSEDWEIIDGTAYSMSPSPSTKHQRIGKKLIYEIEKYLKGKTCELFYELDVILSEKDIVKPDIFIVCDKNKVSDENIKGAPDFVVEILSPSTSKRDKKIKLELYRKFGVKEYWIVDSSNLLIETYIFKQNEIITETYYYDEDDEDNEDNIVEVGIFGSELKIDMKEIFS